MQTPRSSRSWCANALAWARAGGRRLLPQRPGIGLATRIFIRRVALLACLPGAVLAQQQSSQAGGCTLLNPVPDDAMRSFNTDRPTKSNVPYTVDCGHFQYETDVANYARLETAGTVTETYLVPNPTLKLGITGNADVEINIVPYQRIRVRNSNGQVATASGLGDLYARLKVNLWGNSGGNSALALIPYLKAPTAATGIGNGAVEGGIIAPLALTLPGNITLLLNSELDVLKDSFGSGYHPNYLNLVNLSRTFSGKLTLYGELWSDVNSDSARTVRQYSFDTAVAWLARTNLQFDIGVNAGLNSATPSYQVYLGVSQRL